MAVSSTKEAKVYAVTCHPDNLEMGAHADLLPVINQNNYFSGVYVFSMKKFNFPHIKKENF